MEFRWLYDLVSLPICQPISFRSISLGRFWFRKPKKKKGLHVLCILFRNPSLHALSVFIRALAEINQKQDEL